jgi:bifunctional oligoribonuclease and PAP phosphatase NrnA
MISLSETADFLRDADRVLILSHQYPDGDTFGSATALCRGLQKLGRHAMIRCSDEVGPKYQYLFQGVVEEDFTPSYIVAVDIADLPLLGEPNQSLYGDKVDLCIDHHPSNTEYAKYTYVDSKAAATCEIIFHLLKLLNVELDKGIASSLYTGITTDTGCFKYTNVTPETYRIAADLVELGINAPKINRIMFDTKSRSRIDMERRVIDSMQYFCDNRVAVIAITRDMVNASGVIEDDMEGLASIPRGIEGVLVGVMIREKVDGGFKVSLRAQAPLNASEICAEFGGGGHAGAAGCTFYTTLAEAKAKMLRAIEDHLNRKQPVSIENAGEMD